MAMSYCIINSLCNHHQQATQADVSLWPSAVDLRDQSADCASFIHHSSSEKKCCTDELSCHQTTSRTTCFLTLKPRSIKSNGSRQTTFGSNHVTCNYRPN
ncbi:hypothetical protein J6590_003145 [Homalodisca vitripennis]|nr:hypothetical protein J6590_003145 [Homalodisca vitripennis]